MQHHKLILVVDDEPQITKLVRAYLEQSGYQVIQAADGLGAIELFQVRNPDLIILDLMMPGMDGIEVTRNIRTVSKVPIIMLTARTEEIDRLIGLEMGADDYILKPFSPREVVARVKAVLRRSKPDSIDPSNDQHHILSGGALVMNLDTRTTMLSGEEKVLSALQFDMLAHLMRHPDRVFSRTDLLEATQGHSIEAYERTVDAHIKNIRKILGESPRKSQYIHTVHGVGYRFHAPE